MGENVCKQGDQHGINFQNAHTADNTKKKKKKPNKKMGIRPKETFLQRGHTDSQQAHEKRLNITIQFSHSVMSNSLRPHASQHARPPCP